MKKQNMIRKLMVLFCCIMLMAAFSVPAMANNTANVTSGSTIDFSVNIEWLDYNANGRPKSLTINVYRTTASADADRTYVTSQEITPDSDGNWPTLTFSGLPKYDDDGNEYTYSVNEVDVPDGYTAAVQGDQNVGFTIVNTRTSAPKTVNVTKEWVGDATDEVDVNLYADGEVYDTVTLNADNKWTYTWKELPALSDEDYHSIKYTVDEASVPNGYSKSVEGSSGNYTITNTELTDVSVQKVWSDGEGQNRPNSVSVQLYANGVATGDKIILMSDNAWEYTWNNLAKCDSDGNEIEYTVEEDAVDGYKTEITQNGNNFIITNSEVTSVTVDKVWNDGDSADRPESVQVQLYADGVATGDKVTLNEDNGWTYTWSGLDKYNSKASEIEYTIEEDAVDGYTSKVTGNAESGFVVTNTKNVEPTPTIDIPVTKEWASGTTKEPVTVELYRNGNATGITMTLDESNEWKGTFTSQPEYDSIGTKYIYTVKEITNDYTWSVSGSADEGFVITNGTREITAGDPPVRKTITGDKPSKDSRFYFTMTAEPEKSTLPTGMTTMPMPEAADGAQSMTISVKGEGTGEFGDITFTEPGTYVYEVMEKNTGAKGYTYDDTVYEVRYVVQEADDSTTGTNNALTCEKTILKDGVVQSSMTFAFTNKYSAPNNNGGNNTNNHNGDSGKKVNTDKNSHTGNGMNPDDPSKTGSGISNVRTGDTSNIAIWTLVLIASAAAIAIGLFLRKHLSNKN
jgi:pilin isopeptide linkage protein